MEKVRIQDDLYTFVNGEKIEQMVIPGDQPSIGAFQSIAIDVEKTMLNEFKEMCENDTFFQMKQNLLHYLKHLMLLVQV